MVALLVALSIMGIMLSVALPAWNTRARREKETELIFRGQQYARAIALFQRKYGNASPPTIDVLITEHFLRKKYPRSDHRRRLRAHHAREHDRRLVDAGRSSGARGNHRRAHRLQHDGLQRVDEPPEQRRRQRLRDRHWRRHWHYGRSPQRHGHPRWPLSTAVLVEQLVRCHQQRGARPGRFGQPAHAVGDRRRGRWDPGRSQQEQGQVAARVQRRGAVLRLGLPRLADGQYRLGAVRRAGAWRREGPWTDSWPRRCQRRQRPDTRNGSGERSRPRARGQPRRHRTNPAWRDATTSQRWARLLTSQGTEHRPFAAPSFSSASAGVTSPTSRRRARQVGPA